MIQYAKFKLKFPDNINADELKKVLEKKGFKVEITAVFLQMKGFPVPKEFQINSENGNEKN